MARKQQQDNYTLSKASPRKRIQAPDLPYRPRDPKSYRPGIGLIGSGGITRHHLAAYSRAGYDLRAICDLVRSRAEDRQREFFPDADIYTDFRDVLKRSDIEVVDLATHPPERAPLIEAALNAGKHVLSQKPFVIDLDTGVRLVELARSRGVRLAVNQNGRWSPHFSYIRHAIAEGHLGQVMGVHLAVHWDHDWVKDTPFNRVHHIVLYDFAIHWFDILTQFMGDRRPKRVFASLARSPIQKATPSLLGQALVEYDGAQATLVFDANTPFGEQDSTYVAGTEGSITSTGPNLGAQKLTLYTRHGYGSPKLAGAWFDDGFHGTMAELLCAIEEDREPSNSAQNNLEGLGLCFAACASADDGKPKVPGKVRVMNEG